MKRPFSLSPRLSAVADQVPAGARLADVGTDHGRLPVWLVLHGRAERAVASDLRPGPLSRAQALAERWGVSDRISFRLCNGLSRIAADEADTIVITGMGGETIAGILASSRWTGTPGRRYILQAMSGMDGLRRWLNGHGFRILQETLVEEGDTLYVILVSEPGEEIPYSEGEIWVGRQQRGMDSPLRGRYLRQECEKLRRAAGGLECSRRPEDRERLEAYRRALREAATMKEEWEKWQQ